MNNKFRITLFTLVLFAAAALLPSCRGAAEKARHNIRIEGVKAIDMHSLSGADLTLRVRNDTRYKLQLRDAAFDIWLNGTHIGSISLIDKVEVPRRSTQDALLRWRFRIDDPLSLFVLARQIKSGQHDGITISCRITGRGGPARVKIAHEKVPLSDFLRNFGLTINDLKNYF